MDQILNKFLVMQKRVSIEVEEHNSQSVKKKKVLWRPNGSESNLLVSIKVFSFTSKCLESN